MLSPGTHAEVPTSLSVCVIEDDEATRMALRCLLEDAGYHVIEAADGQTGYTLLLESDERLIALIDYKLPRMDGCDLLDLVEHDERLRARHTVIFVTASPKRAEEECGETLEEFDVPVIPKPFNIDEVEDAVSEAVQRLAQQPVAPKESAVKLPHEYD